MNASGTSNPEFRGAFPWLSNNGAPCGIAPWVAACPPSPAPAPNAGPETLLGPAPAELAADEESASECPLLARPGAVMYSSGRTNQARGFVAVRFSAGYESEACAPECVLEVRWQQKCDPSFTGVLTAGVYIHGPHVLVCEGVNARACMTSDTHENVPKTIAICFYSWNRLTALRSSWHSPQLTHPMLMQLLQRGRSTTRCDVALEKYTFSNHTCRL